MTARLHNLSRANSSRCGTTAGIGHEPDDTHAEVADARTFSLTLPWPPVELSPNFRTRSTRWIARKRKEYREAVAQAAWDHGVQPGRALRLDSLTYHPPTAAGHDDDNLNNRFKAGRDGLAEAMGVDDAEFNDAEKIIGSPVKGGTVVAVLTEIPD